jgi:ferredoxin
LASAAALGAVGRGFESLYSEILVIAIVIMGKLIILDSEEEYEIENGSPIAEACEEAGVPFACTEGVCGTCVIEVKEGMENLSSFTQEEEDFLGDMASERLACQCKLKGGTVTISF